MTSKVGPKGQVVIPKRIRERMGIRPGDEVIVSAIEDVAQVRRASGASRLWGCLADGGGDALRELEAEHRWEIEHDERRFRGSR